MTSKTNVLTFPVGTWVTGGDGLGKGESILFRFSGWESISLSPAGNLLFRDLKNSPLSHGHRVRVCPDSGLGWLTPPDLD